jgi:lysophospholipase L1-like esterase
MYLKWSIGLLFLLLPFRLFANDANQSISPVISYLLANKDRINTMPVITSYLLSSDKNLGTIMPLGDSITWDWYYGDTRPDSLRHAYRNHLWWKLQAAHYKMNFVGTRYNGSAVRPKYDGNNEGYTGWSAYQIYKNIYNWLKKNPADIILLHIGTNDSVSVSPDTAVQYVSLILDEIDRFEKDNHRNIKVVLAKIILYPKEADWVKTYNNKLGNMAQNRIGRGDNIVIVDMLNGAGINFSKDLIDGIHPTNCGYEKMANLWFKALTGKPAPKLKSCY